MKSCLVLLLPLCSFAQSQAPYPTQNQVPNPALATDYKSPTAEERVQWVIHSTLGPASLIGGGISAGFGTWVNAPHEYGTHWDGFAQRYGMRTAGVATSNIMEAGIGSLTGEDPRYQRAPGDASFKKRVGHVVAWTFIAPNRDGDMHFAYARLAGIAGSNALSNTWRVESEANTSHFLERTALGFLSHMAGNTWDEFWPDAKRKMFHHGSTYDPGH